MDIQYIVLFIIVSLGILGTFYPLNHTILNINYIILAIPLVITIIGFIGSFIIGNDCVFINAAGDYSGNCKGINNTLTWMKYGVFIYAIMVPIFIMFAPYMLGILGLNYLFTAKKSSNSVKITNKITNNSKKNNSY
jgi:hypothetical protein